MEFSMDLHGTLSFWLHYLKDILHDLKLLCDSTFQIQLHWVEIIYNEGDTKMIDCD